MKKSDKKRFQRKKFESITPTTPETLPSTELDIIFRSLALLVFIVANITKAKYIDIGIINKRLYQKAILPIKNALAICPLKNLFCIAFANAFLWLFATPCFFAFCLNFRILKILVLVIINTSVVVISPINKG